MGLAQPLDLTPADTPTPVGCSDASVAVLPVPLLTTFSISFRSGQRCSNGYTDAISLHHRTFRCLGLAGPPVMFSLDLSAGPRVSLTQYLFLLAKPPPSHTPVRRSAAATPAPPLCCRTRAAPAPLRRRATNLAPVHRLSRAPEPRSRLLAPHLRRLCAADPAPPPVKPARLLRAPCILL